MSDRPLEPMTDYEIRLARDLRAASEHALRSFDATAITRSVALADSRTGIGRRLDTWMPRRMLWLAVIGLLIAAIGIALVGVNGLTPAPPVLGKLAFVGTGVGHWLPDANGLYIADADGTNAHVIASTAEGGADWSPSGRYLTAVSYSVEPAIHILEPDGHEVGLIDASDGYAWSPARDELAVVSRAQTGATIRVVRPDGSLVRRLQTPPGVLAVTGYAWSPDGRRIVIAGCTGCMDKYGPWDSDLWIVEPDGSEPTRLTASPTEYEQSPTWSPDGSVILFDRFVSCEAEVCPESSTWTIRPDGRDATKLPFVMLGAMWSPDGSRLLFGRAASDLPDSFDIFVVDADGSNEVRLTTELGADSPDGWGRDGRQILYYHTAPGDPNDNRPTDLWAMDADGSHKVRLAADATQGGWQWLP